MKRILFVDDEQRILDGLENLLRSHRKEWDMVFASSGEAALVELDKRPFDVVVSDMRMPGMDGATLLRHVKERFPRIVRIVLSGHAELTSALRAIPLTHQFLSKPCSAETLKNVVKRSCDLQALLSDEHMRASVGAVDNLPSPPERYLTLIRLLEDPRASVKEVAVLVGKDMAISAKLLQLVNSAFFGAAQRTSSISSAVTYLGTSMVKNVVLTLESFRSFEMAAGTLATEIRALEEHALATAQIARRMFADQQKSEDAFMAGALHDLGKLIIATRMPEFYARVVEAQTRTAKPMHVIEMDLKGVSHAELGGYLLGLWGLPYSIVEAVAHHHAPMRVTHTAFDVLDAVYIADGLAHGRAFGKEALDVSYLESMGVPLAPARWQDAARTVLEGSAS